jgi:hypothetical protein
MKYYFLSYAWCECGRRQRIHSAIIKDTHPLLWIIEQGEKWMKDQEYYELISWQEIDKTTFEAAERRM